MSFTLDDHLQVRTELEAMAGEDPSTYLLLAELDSSRANDYLAQGIKAGDRGCMWQLGEHYQSATGCDLDLIEAGKLYMQAIDANPQDPKYINLLFQKGSLFYFERGLCFQKGYGGVANTNIGAYNYFVNSISAKDPRCLYYLGNMCVEGKVALSRDDKRNLVEMACEYYFKSAKLNSKVEEGSEAAFAALQALQKKNNITALHLVGECYQYGYGVVADQEQAAICYQREIELLYADLLEHNVVIKDIPAKIAKIRELTTKLLDLHLEELKKQRDTGASQGNLPNLREIISTLQSLKQCPDRLTDLLADPVINMQFDNNLLAVKHFLAFLEREKKFHAYHQEVSACLHDFVKIANAKYANHEFKKKVMLIEIEGRPKGIKRLLEDDLKKLDHMNEAECLNAFTKFALVITEKQNAASNRVESSVDFYNQWYNVVKNFDFNTSYKVLSQRYLVPVAPTTVQPAPQKSTVKNETATTEGWFSWFKKAKPAKPITVKCDLGNREARQEVAQQPTLVLMPAIPTATSSHGLWLLPSVPKDPLPSAPPLVEEPQEEKKKVAVTVGF